MATARKLTFALLVFAILSTSRSLDAAFCPAIADHYTCGTSCADAAAKLNSCSGICANTGSTCYSTATLINLACEGSCSSPTPYGAHRECQCASYCDTGNHCTPGYSPPPQPTCNTSAGYFAVSDGCGCWRCVTSPLIVNLAAGGPPLMSDAGRGVLFDLEATFVPEWVAWPTEPGAGWLVLDRNNNGVVDNGSELFGTATVLASGAIAKHGFEALKELDDNADGYITPSDAAYSVLAVWADRIRNGQTDPDELISLADAGISSIEVNPRESRQKDRWGNVFSLRSKVEVSVRSQSRFLYDVWPVTRPNN
jgi:hypothetical protein